MVKIIAFDLDGTTLKGHSELSAENKSAMLRAHEKGIVLVPATGRLRTFIPEVIREIPEIRYFITSNGAAVYDKQLQKEIYTQALSNEKALEIQKVLDDYDLYVEYYMDGFALTLADNPLHPEKFGIPEERLVFTKKKYKFIENYTDYLKETGLAPQKINMPFIAPELYDEVYRRVSEVSGLFLTSSLPNNLEINSDKTSKGDAIRALIEILDIDKSEVMAIGDNENDVPMLTFAGVSVAMGNAEDDIKAQAKYVTDTCENFGFAKAVEKYALD